MDNKIGIYCIECLINNKKIVGSTKRYNNRVAEHYYKLRNNKHGNKHLQNAYNKYGESNIFIYLIEECSEDRLVELEDYWMEQLNTTNREFGYNFKKAYRQNITEELREIFRISNKGKAKPAGWHHTEEDKIKIRNAQLNSPFKKRKPVNQYTKDGIFIRKFNSIREASDNINAKYNSTICVACKKELGYAFGYRWKYA